MNQDYCFLPMPRYIERQPGEYNLVDGKLILLEDPQVMQFTASRIKKILHNRLNLTWQLATGWVIPASKVGISLVISPGEIRHSQGYILKVEPLLITIKGNDNAGVFNGVCTLMQLIAQVKNSKLPCLMINDWPDFPARGVMLDISRCKVPLQDTLLNMVDLLASWKINQIQLYTEHTFAYLNHPQVWANASPMTGEDILNLDAYCKDRFVELVPNQNSFGHMYHWLKHPQYAPLAETHDQFSTPWGITLKGPFGLAPVNPGSFELIRSLYDELLPYFNSRLVNVGCDETVDLGQGQSKEACEQFGVGRVYLDFLLKIYSEISRRGSTMQFWGDIIIQHPELVKELPRDAIALSWGYDADHPFDQEGACFASSGIPFYVCPGTSSWNTIVGRTDNALTNLANAAENGLRYGANGFLITDWGDNGHWQHLPVSYLGFAAGAAYSWCLDSNRDRDVPTWLDLFAFEDQTHRMGRVVYDLGNVYRAVGYEPSNSSALFQILQFSLGRIRASKELMTLDLEKATRVIDQAKKDIDLVCLNQAPGSTLYVREFKHAILMLRHACLRATYAQNPNESLRRKLQSDLEEMIEEFKALWLIRNRPGGLKDSLERFEVARQEYQDNPGLKTQR